MSDRRTKEAQRLIELELRLDKEGLDEVGIPLGSLLVDYWRHEYTVSSRNSSGQKSITRQCLSILKYVFKVLFSKRHRATDIGKMKLILGKSADRVHLNRLINPVKSEFSNAFLFKSGVNSAFTYLSFSEILGEIYSTFKLLIYLKTKINSVNIKDFWLAYSFGVITILQYFVCRSFLAKTSAKLLLVDYDRGKYIPLVMAAKYLGIKAVTLQHGVINPPYGFYPILADEIWVWGSLWEKLLIRMGVDGKNIRIVGSPIVDSVTHGQPHKGGVKHIGIGPNPIGDKENSELWRSVIDEISLSGCKVTVKLHPSMNKKDHGTRIFGTNAEIIEAAEMDNHTFFKEIDALAVSNSGLGYEAAANGVPVLVRRVSSDSTGNDSIMIDIGGFMELNTDSFFECKEELRLNRDKILNMQKEFILGQVYASVGVESERDLIIGISKHLDN